MIFNFIGSGNQFTATASATVTNTTTETTVLGAGIGSLTLEADSLIAGRTLAILAGGVYSTQAAPVTLRLKVKLGSVVILDTGAQLPVGSLANRGWLMQGVITCRSAGGSGTVLGQGLWNGAVTALAAAQWDMENTATATVDTTASQVLDITATWNTGVAAADSITGSVALVNLWR